VRLRNSSLLLERLCWPDDNTVLGGCLSFSIAATFKCNHLRSEVFAEMFHASKQHLRNIFLQTCIS